MKKIISTFFISCFCLLSFGQEIKDWENPDVIGINKEPYHATLTLPSQKYESGECTSLDGIWKFHWYPRPEVRQANFYETSFDVSSWDDIVVPGEWQMQGYGIPIYTNWTMPFKKDQPRVMSEPPTNYYTFENRNPTGQYVTTFYITKSKEQKVYYLHFTGVESAFYLWVNGQKVGYSQNSMGPAEFNITPFVVDGENRLAVEVYQFSDGSYLEDQDMWRLSGIFRSVDLWTRPKTNIIDYFIKAEPSTDYKEANATININIDNKSKKISKNIEVEFLINGKNAQGKAVSYSASQVIKKIDPYSSAEISLACVIDNPAL